MGLIKQAKKPFISISNAFRSVYYAVLFTFRLLFLLSLEFAQILLDYEEQRSRPLNSSFAYSIQYLTVFLSFFRFDAVSLFLFISSSALVYYFQEYSTEDDKKLLSFFFFIYLLFLFLFLMYQPFVYLFPFVVLFYIYRTFEYWSLQSLVFVLYITGIGVWRLLS